MISFLLFPISYYEKAIKETGSSDPLKYWIEYVQFLKQTYLKEAFRKVVFEILERCVRTFVNDLRYTNDPRYIKLWIAYVFQFIICI